MEPLQLFVIAIIWAIASWIQRKNEAKGAAEEQNEPWFQKEPETRTSDPAPRQPKPAATAGWEEELRMLLEGKTPAPKPKPAAPAPRAAPPAPVAPRPAPPPPLPAAPRQAAEPVVESRTTYFSAAPKLVSDIDGDYFHKGLCVHCGGRLLFPQGAIGHTLNCPHCNTDTPLRPSAALEQQNVAATAYARSRAPGESLADDVAHQFSERDSAQQAVVASIVFGPPKALQPDNGPSLF